MTSRNYKIRSRLSNSVWPAMPDQHGALLMATLHQMEHSQWWGPEQLLEHQLRQITSLVTHAYRTVPYYRRSFDAAGFSGNPGDLTMEALRGLPLLSRRNIQDAGRELMSQQLPREFGELGEAQTSGSTGEAIKVYGSEIDRLIWQAMAMRDHDWHCRDFIGTHASIRFFSDHAHHTAAGTLRDNWGAPVSTLYESGPLALLHIATDIAVQAQWLLRHQPHYLLTYPTNLAALIDYFSAHGLKLTRLREVRTMAETLPPQLRARCQEIWNVPLRDLYSSQELGYVALQCPEGDHYHVMAENVLAEVLDDKGQPCGPGEIGRLVITKLHSFAMPLIRYELRDYAEMGAPCSCGRGLPTLKRIIGRSRNMLTLPDGKRNWPMLAFAEHRKIAPVRQFQFIQHTLHDIEVRFVVDRSLTNEEEANLKTVIQRELGFPFNLSFVYFQNEIPRTARGKFEEFISML